MYVIDAGLMLSVVVYELCKEEVASREEFCLCSNKSSKISRILWLDVIKSCPIGLKKRIHD